MIFFFLIHILIDNSVSKKWILWSNSTLCALLVLSGIKYVMHMWSMLSIRKQRVNSGYTIPQSYSSLFVGKMIKKTCLKYFIGGKCNLIIVMTFLNNVSQNVEYTSMSL